MSLRGYQNQIGSVQARAVHTGGVDLLFVVEGRLGPAHRHVERVRAGEMALVPGVVAEIERSIGYAREALE